MTTININLDGDTEPRLSLVDEPAADPKVTFAEDDEDMPPEEEDGEEDEGTAGLLADKWGGDVAFKRRLAGGRDMSDVEWVWRDPTAALMPLMDQTETQPGHDGAVLAGYIETVGENGDGSLHMTGGFYDTAEGRSLRDRIAAVGRVGVSIDGGEDTTVEAECLEEDDEGSCAEYVERYEQLEVIGVTATPFPAFEEAAISLQENDDEEDVPVEDEDEPEDEEMAVVAAASAKLEWFQTTETDIDDSEYVAQPGGARAVPLTITDTGRVYGHLAVWGTCHIGHDRCVTPPQPDNYGSFHQGLTEVDGVQISSGPLTMATDHAALKVSATAAADHYANTGCAWADVRVSNGEHGPFVAGAVRDGISEDQVRMLQAGSLSGDWRPIDGQLQLVGVLAVNTPGFQVRREPLAASARFEHGELTALVAAGSVKPCSDCDDDEPVDLGAALASIDRRLAKLEEPQRRERIEQQIRRIRGN